MGTPDKTMIAKMAVLREKGLSDRKIAAEVGCAPGTAKKYLADSAHLADPVTKELVAKYRETELDHLTLLGGKARQLLEERLDEKKMTNIEAIALTDRFFTQRRLLEGRSTANLLHGAIVQIQRAALELTLKNPPKTDDDGDGAQPGQQ